MYSQKPIAFYASCDKLSAYMQIASQKVSFKELLQQLEKELPQLFFEKELKKLISEKQAIHTFSESTKARLMKAAEPIDVRWNMRTMGLLYTFNKAQYDDISILTAWSSSKGCYLSHYSALYFNSLIEQRPNHHFITCEKRGKSGGPRAELKELLIKQAFLKAPRRTQNFFEHKKSKYYLLDKLWTEQVGVSEIRLGPRRVIRVTTPERTLLDCLISPQYAGGISTVIKAFKTAQIDLKKLIEYYRTVNPIYPYWQSIGLILDSTDHAEQAKAWRIEFQKEKAIRFYLEHEARPHWKYSDLWAVYYPEGIF